tara:strand:- start:4413 stop:5156 length:744 start_codon:yes stop_codon:yes gene_type:complete
MPYLPSDAAKKSELYDNMINADRNEYQSFIEDITKKSEISGSVNTNVTPRDENGNLVSFESNVPGVALEEKFQEVRLPNTQYFFNGTLDSEFTYYGQPKDLEDDDSGDGDTGEEDSVDDEVVERILTNRDYLVEVVSEIFGEDLDESTSTAKLNAKLQEFFLSERKRYKFVRKNELNKNAEGWEEFRLNKKRNVRGISKKRFKEIKKDLKKMRYDEIIEDHLYRTLKGQEVWLKLGFPYVIDKNIKS